MFQYNTFPQFSFGTDAFSDKFFLYFSPIINTGSFQYFDMLIYPSASASGSPAAGSSGSGGGGGGAAAAAEGGGGGGGGKRENLPPGLHHHVVPTERAGSLEVYVQVIFVCLRKSAI